MITHHTYKQQMQEIYELCNMLFLDEQLALDWMYNKNSYFFDKTPEDVVILGDGIIVIDFLKERLGII